MLRIMRLSLASSSTRALSEAKVVEEVMSVVCGWRWPIGADQGLVAVSHPDGSALAVGAGGAASSSIGNRHLENRPVACADTGAADISEKTSTTPESVYLIIGRLPYRAPCERFWHNRPTLESRYSAREPSFAVQRSHVGTLMSSRERASWNKARGKAVV
jgi:hypothetical protein